MSSSYIYRYNGLFGMCSNLFNDLYHPSFPLLGSNGKREDSYLLQPLYWLQHDVITAIESRPTKQKLNPAVTYGFCLICYLMLCILVCDTIRLVLMKEMLYEQYCILSPGDVAGQFTAAPPTCPGDTFTFRCNVTGDMSGETRWLMNRNIECALQHWTSSTTTCGHDVFTATSRTGFGTNGPIFTSTLSGTATPSLNGTLVECFGPARNVNPGNKVGDSNLLITGQYHKSKFKGAVM